MWKRFEFIWNFVLCCLVSLISSRIPPERLNMNFLQGNDHENAEVYRTKQCERCYTSLPLAMRVLCCVRVCRDMFHNGGTCLIMHCTNGLGQERIQAEIPYWWLDKYLMSLEYHEKAGNTCTRRWKRLWMRRRDLDVTNTDHFIYLSRHWHTEDLLSTR